MRETRAVKTNILLFLAANCLLAFARAADPAALFVNDLIAARNGEVWFIDDTLPVPKGGYLYRFELDINGDGQTEVFIATSLNVFRRGELWSAFKKNAAGEYFRIKNSYLLGGELRMRIENGIRKFSFYVPQKQAEGGCYLGHLWIDATGAWHDETHVLTDAEQATKDGDDPDVLGADGKPDDQKIASKLKLGSAVTITIKKVLLAKYVQNPSSPWRDIKASLSLAQQYKDPADAADIASIANWQPPANP